MISHLCLKSRRACPPEDCGEPPDYERLLGVLQNLSDPEHEELREWVGDHYEPEAFSVEQVNADLKDLRQGS